jgi:hypothetical protein
MRGTKPLVRLVFFALAVVASVTALSAARASARPWLGVFTQEVTGDLRDGLDLHANGVLVNRVVADSPADRAGIRQGDVLVRFGSRSIESPDQLARLVQDARDGQVVGLEINRHGDRRTLQVTLAERPGRNDDEPGYAPRPSGDDDEEKGDDDDHDESDQPRKDIRVHIDAPDAPDAPPAPHAAPVPHVYRFDSGDPEKMKSEAKRMAREIRVRRLDGDMDMPQLRGLMDMNVGGRARLGVRIEPLTEDLGSALDAPGGRGVLVMSVMKDTPAERAGLKAGDVIVGVNGHEVGNAEELHKALADVDGRCSIEVSRKGSRRTVDADLGSRERSDRDEDSYAPERSESREHVMRLRDHDNVNSENQELRQQLDQLRQELKELRRQLEDQKERR